MSNYYRERDYHYSDSRLDRGRPTLSFLVISIVCILICVIFTILAISQTKHINYVEENYTFVIAKIIDYREEVSYDEDDDEYHYSYYRKYEYVVDNEEYVAWGTSSTSSRPMIGSKKELYYNPNNPYQIDEIKDSYSNRTGFYIVAAITGAVGILFLIIHFSQRSKYNKYMQEPVGVLENTQSRSDYSRSNTSYNSNQNNMGQTGSATSPSVCHNCGANKVYNYTKCPYCGANYDRK